MTPWTGLLLLLASGQGPELGPNPECHGAVEMVRSAQRVGRDEALLMSDDCRRLARNAAFARHGRAFADSDISFYFGNQDWYAVNPKYSDKLLGAVDKANVALFLALDREVAAVRAALRRGAFLLRFMTQVSAGNGGPLASALEGLASKAHGEGVGALTPPSETIPAVRICHDGARAAVQVRVAAAMRVDVSVDVELATGPGDGECVIVAGPLAPRSGVRLTGLAEWRGGDPCSREALGIAADNPHELTCSARLGDWDGDGREDRLVRWSLQSAPSNEGATLLFDENGTIQGVGVGSHTLP